MPELSLKFPESITTINQPEPKDVSEFSTYFSAENKTPIKEKILSFVKANQFRNLLLIDSETNASIDIMFSSPIPFDQQLIQRRRKFILNNQPVYFASAEDVIVMKIVSLEQKDIEDVKMILVSTANIDKTYIKNWSDFFWSFSSSEEKKKKYGEIFAEIFEEFAEKTPLFAGISGRAKKERTEENRAVDLTTLLMRCLNNKAEVLNFIGSYEKATATYKKLFRVATNENIEDRVFEAYSLLGQGQVNRNLSDFPATLEHYTRALDIFEKLNKKEDSARTMIKIADVYIRQVNYDKTLEELKKALGIIDKMSGNEIKELKVEIFYLLGATHRLKGNYDGALIFLKEAESYSSDSSVLEHKITHETANCLCGKKDYDKVSELYQKAIKMAKNVGDIKAQIIYLTSMVQLYYERAIPFYNSDEHEKKKEWLDKAIAAATEADKLNKRIRTKEDPTLLRLFAGCYILNNQYELAKMFIKKLLTRTERGNLRNRFGGIKCIGHLYECLGDDAKKNKSANAIEFYEKARRTYVHGLKLAEEAENNNNFNYFTASIKEIEEKRKKWGATG
ncbi:tetratricopeptide repeat protein [candidate division TA06 bacterium]|uniref:Tetratricopeptide repeat protein n=1 Tax=candidate division TA06 bacterium TaxID=2250710 RepID=A0A933I9E1_UNCT6|nr:tetratricopeptide repeat protein [candidate division TA06 bacterium]